MSQKGLTRPMVILIEAEIRAAAKLLIQAVEKQHTDECGRALVDAANACIVALNGAENDDAILFISAAHSLIMPPVAKKK